MTIESKLYYYGLGVGIPYRTLNSLADVVAVTRHASDVNHRRQLAREMLANSPWVGFMPRAKGYARVEPETLPGTREALGAVREIIAERRKTGWRQRAVNPVDHLEIPEDFRDHPALLKFALSDAMLQIVSDYYGMVPQLKEVGIWVTRPQKSRTNSQLFHLDKPETQIVGLFMNVEHNGREKGPTTFIPADVSQRVRHKTNYESVYFRGDGYLSDELVFQHCRPENQISLEGGPGTGAIVDTSNCFHFGSRCQSGERIMMMVKFMLPHRARKNRTALFDLIEPPADQARRLALVGAIFKSDSIQAPFA
jgi:hypothetical protein